MRAIWEKIKREPALLLGLIGAGFTMFASFGLTLSDAQTASITAFVVVVLAIITRQSVTPNVSVAAKEAHAPIEQNAEVELVAGEASEVLTGAPVDVVATSDPRAYADQDGPDDEDVRPLTDYPPVPR